MSIFDSWDSALSAGAGLAAANYAIGEGKDSLASFQENLLGRSGVTDSGTLASQIAGGTTFKPFTVTSGAGTGTFGAEGLTLSPNATQQALQQQAQGMTGALGGSIAGLNNLGAQAFGQARGLIGTNAGAQATQMGNQLFKQGQQLMGAQAPSDLARLQTAMTTQGLQSPTGPSRGLLGMQGLMGQADFSGAGADVSGAYSGIQAPDISTGAQGVAGQALGSMNLGAQAQDVSGMFSGISPSQFTDASGQLAQQALSQADLGAQAQDVTGAFEGITAPSTRTGAGAFSSGALEQATGMLGAESPTASSIYDQIRAMQTPEEERQRTALENRLAAQGRLGVQTAQYGGTPEQLALEKAQAEARNQASLQALTTADTLASSQQARAAQLGQLGLSGEQIQAQLDAEGFGQEMQLGQARLQEAQTQEALQSSVQQRQSQLAQLGLSADQIQNQLISEGFGQEMQLGQARIQSAQAQSALQSEMQARQAQLAQLGLSAEQIQAQLNSEGFGQAMQLAQGGIQAQQAQSALENESQARASQLAQLGMSAEQIASQLQTEGLSRTQSSAQLAAQLAQTGAGIRTQQQQLGQGLLGLGLQGQELGGQLGAQNISNAAQLMSMGQGATMLPSQLQNQELANITQTLTAAGIPLQQQLATLQPALQQAQLQQAGQLAGVSALSQLGTAELGMLKELGLGGATLDQELLRSIGNIFAGGGSGRTTTAAAGSTGGGFDVGGIIDGGLDFLGGLFSDDSGGSDDYTEMNDDEFLAWLGDI